MLRRLVRIGLALIAILIAPAGTSLAQTSPSSTLQGDDPPFSTYVTLTNANVEPNTGDSVLDAFVVTGSVSHNCLVSPGESNNAVAGTVVFCGVRAPSISGGVPGILIHVFFPGPVVNNLIFTATVHQNGAKQYGPAVPCFPADGC
jgi:hypothetical protein